MNIRDIENHYADKNAAWLESHLAGLDAIGREMPPGLFTEMEMHKIRLIVAAALRNAEREPAPREYACYNSETGVIEGTLMMRDTVAVQKNREIRACGDPQRWIIDG